jgi:peptidoglycan DL-endopeptidase CwlO
LELHTTRPQRSRLTHGLFRAVFGTAVGVLLVALGPASLAHAAPETPAEIEKRIDAEWQKIEPLVEQHNTLKVRLSANKAKASQLAEKIKPLQVKLDAAMASVSKISVEAYMGKRASAFNAILTQGTAADLVDQLSMLNAMAKIQTDQVAGVMQIKKQYDAEKKPYDDLVAQLSQQEAQVAALRKTAEAGIAELNRMRLTAYGTTTGPGALRPVACPVQYDGSPGAKAAQVACAQIGKPYIFATAGPNTFDCSGLVKYAWGTQGVRLSHSSSIQYNSETTHISRAQLAVGDLVFFYSGISHVGMYVGDNWMVEAPNAGGVVQMKKIDSYSIYGFGRPG